MRICPGCYTAVYFNKAENCPYCGVSFVAPQEEEYVVPKSNSTKIILQFTIVSVGLMMAIFAMNFIVKTGIGVTGFASNCQTDENCFLAALAACEPDVDVNPRSYGLIRAQIRGERDGFCMVHVESVEYDDEQRKEIAKPKICAFAPLEIAEAGMDDLFFCDPHDDLTAYEAADVSDEEWVDTVTKQIDE